MMAFAIQAPAKRVLCKACAGYEQAQVDAAVEAVFAFCPNAGRLGPHSRVLLKPNLLAKHPPERAVTTHPAVVAACIRACMQRGVLPQNITVADSPGGAWTPGGMRAIYAQSGMAAVCEETGAALYLGCKAGVRKTQGERVHSFELMRPVLDADFIIDIPKVKTHVMVGMTCAVKNLFGTVPGLSKAEFHMRFPAPEDFGGMLADLCEAVRPDMVVADGIVAMEGDGPASGTPYALGLILGGQSAYDVDLAVCRLMGLAPQRVPYLAAAVRRGLCAAQVEEGVLCGDVQAAAPRAGFCLPTSMMDLTFAQKAPRPIRWLVPGAEKWVAPRPKVKRALCIGCGKCAEICPGRTIRVQGRKAHISRAGCIRCFCCHEMCPVKAIEVRRFALFRR